MRFLANENFPYTSIRLIRESGYQVVSIGEEYGGMSDVNVIKFAQENQLIILTLDSDYGELIFRHGLPNPPTVVYFRYKQIDASFPATKLLDVLATSQPIILGRFTVIEENNIRQRIYLTK